MSPRETAWGAYAQIAETLRQRILNGGLAPDFPFPSEAMLCEEFAVVRNTIRRALAALEDEGLIETLPGKGRAVRGDAPIGMRIGTSPMNCAGRSNAENWLPATPSRARRRSSRATVSRVVPHVRLSPHWKRLASSTHCMARGAT